MAALADRVGVSRQTVYNEVGSKQGLAEAMILRELARFLGVVSVAFDEHPDDLVDAIRAASYGVLELAQDNKLLHAVVSATHGADTELLPLLTTHSESLLAAAKQVVDRARRRRTTSAWTPAPRRRHRHGGAGGAQPRHAADRRRPPTTADDIAWLAGRVLRADFSALRRSRALQSRTSGIPVTGDPGYAAAAPCASSTASRNAGDVRRDPEAALVRPEQLALDAGDLAGEVVDVLVDAEGRQHVAEVGLLARRCWRRPGRRRSCRIRRTIHLCQAASCDHRPRAESW